MNRQHSFPSPGTVWNPGPPDLTGYVPPDRSCPALTDGVLAECAREGRPVVTVLGSLRDERVPGLRSWSVWSRQRLPAWLTVEYLFLDDGSADGAEWVLDLAAQGAPVRLARFRAPGDPTERSCTLLFNAAVRQLVRSPLVMIQWWDRIPGSFDHLRLLVEPHRHRGGILTSAVTRHVGGSSSVHEMTPEVLAQHLALAPWERDPGTLALVAGQIGGHCVPGQATESSGCVWPIAEFEALGGYDERYTTRAGYSNVELWRRALQAGLVAEFVPEPHGANYHQSHRANRVKDDGWLADLRVRRNVGVEWGSLAPLDVRP